MSGLETATDILAIIFMSTITLTFLAFLVIALVLKRKVGRLIDSVQEKVDIVRDLPIIGKRVFRAAKR